LYLYLAIAASRSARLFELYLREDMLAYYEYEYKLSLINIMCYSTCIIVMDTIELLAYQVAVFLIRKQEHLTSV
jgi:hypothetical protein